MTSGGSPKGEDDAEDKTEIKTTIDRTSSIAVTKEADVDAVRNAGDEINYTIVVTNTGNTTLTNVVIEDPLTGLKETIEELAPGAAIEFETSYTMRIEDEVSGESSLLNVATITYRDPITEEEVTEKAEQLVAIECIDGTLTTGIIFRDLNDNNIYEPELGETPIPNVPVVLIPSSDTPGDALLMVTGSDGRYTFRDFVPGTYTIQVRDVNLNVVQNLFPTGSSLAFPTIDVCDPFVNNFGYDTYEGIVLGDFVWYDINGDGIQNEWFDANDDGQVSLNDLAAGPIKAEDWEWFDLNGDGRYDGPENDGELNKAGFGVVENTSGNVRVTGPNGYDETIIVGIAGYWRTRPYEDDNKFLPPAGVDVYGEYTATIIEDDLIAAIASFMESTGKVKVLPNEGGRLTDINGTRFEERCGLTTEGGITRLVTPEKLSHADMDFGFVCVQAPVEIIASGDNFISNTSSGGNVGNVIGNDTLDGKPISGEDVSIEIIDFGGIEGLVVNPNGDLELIPGLNSPGVYVIQYKICEIDFPTNCTIATIIITIEPDKVDLSVTKTSFGVKLFEGDEFEYLIRIQNDGNTSAANVEVVDVLPAGLTYVSSTVSGAAGAATVSGQEVKWNFDTLPAGGFAEITLRVKADPLAEGQEKSFTNTATVNSSAPELSPENNSSSAVVSIRPFFIPNVITPNGDRKNDVFVINGLGKFASNELVIFNRFGDHVFERKGYQNDWNANGLVSGTYFYVLSVVDANGNDTAFKGWIQVIRED
jgi:uncharacterized repeat protein (TIGR01451 family)/gliding motility-associated-like protein